ncbi:helix-turn-helix domain-containing protein [Neobacillus sp. Marseille-QA0830]
MASNRMMIATAQALSTRNDYNFKSTIETVNAYFDLGSQEYAAFTYIAGLSELCQGVSFPSQSKIAEKLGVDRTRANKIISQLVKKGLLIVVKVEGIRNNFYVIPTIAELLNRVAEKVKAITSKIKESIKKTAEKVAETVERVQEVFASKKENKPQTSLKGSQNGFKKTPIRTEYLPDWWEESTRENEEKTQVKQNQDSLPTKESILEMLRSAGF